MRPDALSSGSDVRGGQSRPRDPTAEPLALLDADLAEPVNSYLAPRLWTRLLAGDLGRERLRLVALQVYPVIGGRARNALFSKISNLDFEDGKVVFQRLYERTRDKERDPEALWRRFALAAGNDERALGQVLEQPLLEAREFVEQARWFGHRSAHEAAVVSYAVETQLPALWGKVGAALRDAYGFAAEPLRFFDLEAAELERNRQFSAHLVARYCDTSWKLFLGRRAAREVNWAWQALSDRIESLL